MNLETNPGYFARRWRGQVRWTTLYWRDLALLGTTINLVNGVLTMILLAKDVAIEWVLALHLMVFPYNLFLVLSVWRRSDMPDWARWSACAWLILTLLV